MPATQHLHHLLDQVPESHLPTVERMIAALSADYDDEPYPDYQRARDAETIAGIDRGEPSLTSEELARQLGL